MIGNITNLKEASARLVMRADAECSVYCDGDFITLLNGRIEKTVTVPTGTHQLEFISTEHQDAKVYKTVECPEESKKYLVLVNDLKATIQLIFQQKEEEEKRKKEEEEAKRTLHFTDSFGNKGKYVGEHMNGVPEGEGTFTTTDGRVYDCSWKNGKRTGKGKVVFADGDKYEGEWKDDKYNGHGVYTFADGRVYNGEWKDDKRQGHGVLTWPDGDKYEGEWKDDKRHGHGVFTECIYIYEGTWVNDNIHGIIVITDRETGKKSKHYYKNGSYDGKCILGIFGL